jgi:hypothetical protein
MMLLINPTRKSSGIAAQKSAMKKIIACLGLSLTGKVSHRK